MDEKDIEWIKEKYSQYKFEHYEEERQMRKLLKLKKLVPNIATDEVWAKDFKQLNENLSEGLYYYDELKARLPEKEFNNFISKVKFNVLKQRYLNLNLNQLEEDLYEELETEKELLQQNMVKEPKVFPKVEEFEKNLFAKAILEEKELIKKVKIIRKYQQSTIDVFFDTTSVLKAEIARLFVDQMNLEGVSKNNVMTASLVYAFKRTNSPKEIERIKKEKEEDKKFLQSLGFDETFCKICSEYNRYHEAADYEREKEGNILELVDKFVGLMMHREDRLAFPVLEALDLLDTKILAGSENPYKAQFIEFIHSLEKREISKNVGIMTYFASRTNQHQRQDFVSVLETILKVRELIGGEVNEHKVMRLEKLEKMQDKFSLVQMLQKIIGKLKEKITNMSKILKGYKRLLEGNQEKEESLDR